MWLRSFGSALADTDPFRQSFSLGVSWEGFPQRGKTGIEIQNGASEVCSLGLIEFWWVS